HCHENQVGPGLSRRHMNPSPILPNPSPGGELFAMKSCPASHLRPNPSQSFTGAGEGFGEGFQRRFCLINRKKLSLSINTTPVPALARAMRFRTRTGAWGMISGEGLISDRPHPSIAGDTVPTLPRVATLGTEASRWPAGRRTRHVGNVGAHGRSATVADASATVAE